MGAPEPWLAGRFADLAPVPRFVCCSLELALADLQKHIGPLTPDQLWARTNALESAGFHVRHIAGSLDRLLTYARGAALSADQLAALQTETKPGADAATLLEQVIQICQQVADFAQTVSEADLVQPRHIGRLRHETPLAVLLAHMAEHTQRHTGQAVVLAKLAAR